MENINEIYNLGNIEIQISILKTIFISMCTYFLGFKLINKKPDINLKVIFTIITICINSVICSIIKYEVNYLISIVCIILILGLLFAKNSKNNIGSSIMVITITLTINHILFICSVILNFILNSLCRLNLNDYMNLAIMIIIHIVLLQCFVKMKKINRGISFLQKNSKSENIDIIVLNICIIVLFVNVLLTNYERVSTRNSFLGFIIFSIIMFITIQKSLQLYYKQKLLEQELNKTKEDLANQIKDNKELEAENIEISKKAHTLDHKQKSLAKKIDEMLLKAEISKEEAAEVRERLNKIGKELYKEKSVTKLKLTEIPEIDDMLKFMQSECSANKIEFELQIKGNIHYMTNNFISKEDLETLLADHIKNAIIAINHTDNVNRSILVKLGKIDENYGLYIYDSGVEFEKETLENLGKKPSTTHKDEGGTGMGFMNTFDTLRKCNASLIIEEFGKPNKDNYTKAIMIKFDNKNEFKIKKRE